MTIAERPQDSAWNRPLLQVAEFLCLFAFAALTSRQPCVAVGAAAGLAAIAALSSRLDKLPKLGLFVIVAAMPFEFTRTMGNPMTSLPKLVFAPAFVVLVALRIFNGKPFTIGRQQGWAAIAFIGSVLLAAFLTGGVSYYKLWTISNAIGVFLFFILAVNVLDSERDIHSLICILVISNVVSATMSLTFGLLGLSFFGLQADNRLGGLLGGEANCVSLFALMGLCFVPYLFMTVRWKWIKPALIGATIMMLLTLLYSLSRFAMIALAICAVYAALRWHSMLRLGPTGFFLALVLILTWQFLPPNLADRMQTLSNIERVRSDGTVRQRTAALTAGFDMFIDSPLWGIGPGQWLPTYASPKYRFLLSLPGRRLATLNAYGRALAEQGLLGLASFLLLMGFSFHALWAVRRLCASEGSLPRNPSKCDPDGYMETVCRLWWQSVSVEIGLLAMAVTGLSQPSLFLKYMWLMFALSAVIYRVAQREAIRRKPTPDGPSQAARRFTLLS